MPTSRPVDIHGAPKHVFARSMVNQQCPLETCKLLGEVNIVLVSKPVISWVSKSSIKRDILLSFARVEEYHLRQREILLDESKKVTRLTGNLRQMEEMREIVYVRVSKQEQPEALPIDARHAKRAVRSGLQ